MHAKYPNVFNPIKLGPVEIPNRFFFSPHGVHLTEAELARCHATGTAIAHCPTSNFFLGSGCLDVFRLQRADRRVHVGLGPAVTADRVDIQWPDGRMETIRDVAADQLLTIREGEGLVARTPLAR